VPDTEIISPKWKFKTADGMRGKLGMTKTELKEK